MDFQRLIIFAALFFTLMMIWEAWQEDYVRPLQPRSDATETQTAAVISNDLPTTQSLQSGSMTDAPTHLLQNKIESQGRIKVSTDLYEIEIDAKGGDLRQLDLLLYPVESKHPDKPFRLLDDKKTIFIAQSGLLSTGSDALLAPNHQQIYRSEQSSYSMEEGSDQLTVTLFWKGDSGMEVDKIYTFHRGEYLIDVTYRISNNSTQEWSGHAYHQLQREQPVDEGQAFIYTYTGGVLYSKDEHYEKISFDDISKADLKDRSIQGGWTAMIQHYFVGAWIPDPSEKVSYYSKSIGDGRYILGGIEGQKNIPAGETSQFTSRLFVGPKLQSILENVAEGLELTVDYGILTIIAAPLFWLLDQIHSLVKNWGVSIILLTLMIKIVFYKLSETSYRSMAHMRKVQPKMVAMKERYADDRAGLNQAMMKLYKEEKINPLGGCLPILVQIPVFIALYWMILETVEMRQAPFMLWITDLSSADQYFILPLLMGITMFIQQRLNPTPLDPIQAKVMMALPVVFTVFFAFFPAGLVLYWVTNNTLSIAQQWYITRIVISEK